VPTTTSWRCSSRAHAADNPLASDLFGDLMGLPRAFHEITDRQVNIEWTAPERRTHIARFVSASG